MFRLLRELRRHTSIYRISQAGIRLQRAKPGVAEGIFRHDISIRLPCGSVVNEALIDKCANLTEQYGWYEQMTQLHLVDFYRRFPEFQRQRLRIQERMFFLDGEVPQTSNRGKTSRRVFHQEVYTGRPNPRFTSFQTSIATRHIRGWSSIREQKEFSFSRHGATAKYMNHLGLEIGELEGSTVYTVSHTAGESSVSQKWPHMHLQLSRPINSSTQGTLMPEYLNDGNVGIAYPFFFPKTKRVMNWSAVKSYKKQLHSYANQALHAPWRQDAIQQNTLDHSSKLLLGCILPTTRQPIHYIFDAARKFDVPCLAVRPIPNRTGYSKVEEQDAGLFRSKLKAWGPSKAVLYLPSNYNISSVHDTVRSNGIAQLEKEQKVCTELGIQRYMISPPCARLGYTGHAWCIDTAVQAIVPLLETYPNVEICLNLGFARHRLALSNRIESVHAFVTQMQRHGNNAGVVIDLLQCHLVGFDVETRPLEFLQHLFSVFKKDDVKAIILGDTTEPCGSHSDVTPCRIGTGRLATSTQAILSSDQITGIPVYLPNKTLDNTQKQQDIVRGMYLENFHKSV